VDQKGQSTAQVAYTGPRSPKSAYIQIKYNEMNG